MAQTEKVNVVHSGAYGYSSQDSGRSTCYIDCPFCKTAVLCYVWSLSGSGKRCPTCRAKITNRTAEKTYKTAKSCSKSCSSSDFRSGGKCDLKGCFRYDLSVKP